MRSVFARAAPTPQAAAKSAVPRTGYYAELGTCSKANPHASSTTVDDSKQDVQTASSVLAPNGAVPRARNATGAGRQTGVKQAINQWLAKLTDAVLAFGDDVTDEKTTISNQHAQKWCLLLESRDLLTVHALYESSVLQTYFIEQPDMIAATSLRNKDSDRSCEWRVMIPNPDIAECEAMQLQNSELTCIPTTSHVLIDALEKREKSVSHSDPTAVVQSDQLHLAESADRALKQDFVPLQWKPGASRFALVWLDYCGTFTSRAGRQRQADIIRLCTGRLLSPHALLVLTFSRRGATPLYRHEVVDSLVLFVAEAASRAGLSARCVGVVDYSISGPMYTVAFMISETIDEHVLRDLPDFIYDSTTTFPPAQFFAEWNCDPTSRAMIPSPLWSAQNFTATQFSRLAEGAISLLAFDSKLLPVTCAFTKAREHSSVLAAVADPLDCIVAERVAQQAAAGAASQHAPSVVVKVSTPCELLVDSTPSEAFDAIWLGYEQGRAFSAYELARCSEWRDLSAMFASNVLNSRRSFLAISINHSNTNACWEGCWIDWLAIGVQLAATRAGTTATLQFFAKMVIGVPRLVVVFFLSNTDSVPEIPSLIANNLGPAGVKEWESGFEWDFDRLKIPSASSKKFRSVSGYVGRVIQFAEVTRALLHEPGYHFVLPTLATMKNANNISCLTANDAAQTRHVRRLQALYHGQTRLIAIQGSVSENVATYSQALILLCDGGRGQFRDLWSSLVQVWVHGQALKLHSGLNENISVAVVMMESSEDPDLSIFSSELQNLALRSGLALHRNKVDSVGCDSRRFIFGAFFLAATDDTLKRAEARWSTSPKTQAVKT